MNAEQSNNSPAVNKSGGNTYYMESLVARTMQIRAKRNGQDRENFFQQNNKNVKKG